MKKNIIFIISQIFFLVNLSLAKVNEVPVAIDISPAGGAVCPGNWITYVVNSSVDISNGCTYRWSVSNGQIEGFSGSTVNESSGSINVKWNDTTNPGTISVSLRDCVDTGSDSESYTIKSINGATPSTTNGSTTANVSFCATSATFAVHPLKLHNTNENVAFYEWVIPSGWKYSSTETSDGSTPYRTSSRSISVIPASCGGTSVKVRGVNICDGSPTYYGAWLNISVNRAYNATIAGPGSVSCGVNTSVTYSVPASSCVTSYSWTKPASWTGSSTTNSVTFQTNGNPGGLVKVTANICGATPSKEMSIGTALTPTINGPSLFCGTSTTFSVLGGTSATWNLSPSSMFFTSSGSGKTAAIQSKLTQGQGTITFNVQGCGQTKTVSKTFWVGKPTAPTTSPSGTPAVQTSVGAITSVQASTPGATASSLNWWTSSSNLKIVSQGSGNVVVESRAIGYYYLYVTSSNSCGTSPSRQIPFNVTYSGGGGGALSVNIYPNPVDEVLTVELADSSATSTNNTMMVSSNTAGALNSTASNLNLTAVDSTLSVELYNQYQVKVKEGFGVEGKVQLEVHDLLPGTYFLHIRLGEAVLQKQIVIE